MVNLRPRMAWDSLIMEVTVPAHLHEQLVPDMPKELNDEEQKVEWLKKHPHRVKWGVEAKGNRIILTVEPFPPIRR